MGLTVGIWRFPDRDPPGIGEVRQALEAATGLPVELSPDGRVLDLPSLRQVLLGWEYEADALTLHGYIPAHPYLWENLDRVMTTLGGICSADPISWRPRAGDAFLRRRWDALSRRDHWLLRRGPLLASRPWDRFLSGRRAALSSGSCR